MISNPEIHSPAKIVETAQEYWLILSLLAASFPIFGMAFSYFVKQQIRERDGWKSVISGRTDNLEAAHINHDKSSKQYDDSRNGRLLTTDEHYQDHYNRHGKKGLGLTKKQNKWALQKIWKRLSAEERKKLPPPDSLW